MTLTCAPDGTQQRQTTEQTVARKTALDVFICLLSPLKDMLCLSLTPVKQSSEAPALARKRAYQLQSFAEGESMGNLKGLPSIVSELRAERTNLVNQLKHVDAALSVLGKLNSGRSFTKPSSTVSAVARKRMSLAQKARWAKKTTNDQGKPKRTMSASARRKIAAAQRARWAKFKALQKKAA